MKATLFIYRPGLFTLAALLMMFITLSPPPSPTQFSLKFLIWPVKSRDSLTNHIFRNIHDSIRIKRHQVVKFNRSQFPLELNQFYYARDTTILLTIPLHENTYGDFVFIINECVKQHVRRYYFYPDCLYIFSANPLPPRDLP